jgi:hypothetical protein
VAFLCVGYHRIGEGDVEPYDEFGIVVPAVHGSTALPTVSFLGGPTGYVRYLPATPASGRALGVGSGATRRRSAASRSVTTARDDARPSPSAAITS